MPNLIDRSSLLIAVAVGMFAADVAADVALEQRLLVQPETETTERPPPRVAPDWTVRLEPKVWFVAPSGTLKLPISSGDGPGSVTTAGDDVELERLNLDSPRLEPAGDIHLASGRWLFGFSGATFSLDRDRTTADETFRLGAVSVAPGDSLRVAMEFTTAEVLGGYRVYSRDFAAESELPENAYDAVLGVYVVGGARFYDLGIEVRRAGGAGPFQADVDQFFAEPIAGLRFELDFAREFSMVVQTTAGGFADSDRSSISFDVQAGFQWRFWDGRAGLQIGYRQLLFVLTDGSDGPAAEEFEYDGRMAGLFAGLQVRF